MRDNGAVALEAQKQECLSAIADIKNGGSYHADCTAHSAMSRGLIALLRCKVAEVEIRQDEQANERAGQSRVRAVLWQFGLRSMAVCLGLGIGLAFGQAPALARWLSKLLQ